PSSEVRPELDRRRAETEPTGTDTVRLSAAQLPHLDGGAHRRPRQARTRPDRTGPTAVATQKPPRKTGGSASLPTPQIRGSGCSGRFSGSTVSADFAASTSRPGC